LYRIADHDREHVIRTLTWLITSDRPLNVEELAEAIAVDPHKIQLDLADRFLDTEEIPELCSSLIALRPDGMVVSPIFRFMNTYFLIDSRTRPHI
jgi:hypothetical protein